MSIEDALNIIHDPTSSFAKRVEAASALADLETTPLTHLLECLKLTGLPAEIAVMKLYKRTKRPGPQSPLQFVASYDDWLNYLKQNSLL